MQERSFDPAIELPLMEHFYTIQGEGKYSGTAAYFIRLGGCDVGCVWCDVKDSWDALAHPLVKIDTMVDYARSAGAKMVVITGGEPLMYDLTHLTRQLQEVGIRVHVETSGAHPISGYWDWVCLSPKKFKPCLDAFYPQADELKVVVFNKHDLQWAETHAALVRKDCTLLLQPEWSKSETMLPLIVEYVKGNPQWQISLQTHKFMEIP
ncbi:MAG: 7-carboxy-7-deazaguanine synthase QueE [Bacteroidota bacterium]